MAVEEDVFTTSSYSISSLTQTSVEITLSGRWITKQINGNLGSGVLIVETGGGGSVINGSVSYTSMSGTTTATITGQGLSPGTEYAIPECAGNIFYDGARLDIPTRISFTTLSEQDDTSFLNKRGLAYFWGKIDDKKQNKLTPGSNITISGDTISASQPTVNNGTLTIQKNGTNVQTFTANSSSNKTANITVPTKTSDLTNDSDFVEDASYVHTDNNYTTAEKNKLSGIAAGAEVNVQSDWNQTTTTADDYIKNKPTKVSDFTNDAGYITSYTDTQVTQTRVDPSEITTFYPVASTTSYTNTGDVKKFGAVKLKYASDDGGTAELELGQNSYNDPVGGALTLWNMGSSQYKTTLQRSLGASNQTFYFPYNADSTSGTLIANGAATAGTGSATNPVYADRYGILHATTYALNKTVPSDAVFTDTTYSNATTSAAGLMSASDKTKLNGIATGAEVNVQSDWNVTSTSSDAFIKNKPTIPTRTSQLTNDSGFLTSYIETDPVFSASPAAGITDADISSWDAKSDFSGSYNDLTNKPTIGNATLTIQKNGTNVQTFTANATSNKTANITVPTKTSDLTNDSGFVDATAIAGKQDLLTAGDHINITGTTIKAVDYVHSEQPVATQAVTPVVTGSMISNGTITADKLASGATVQLTLSNVDIGEGSALAANTLYGVYQ